MKIDTDIQNRIDNLTDDQVDVALETKIPNDFFKHLARRELMERLQVKRSSWYRSGGA